MVPAAPFGVDPMTGLPFSDKDKTTAGLLQLFLPGVGRMYIGHIGLGIAQIIVSVFTCIGALWPFIDGIMILTGNVRDAQGRPLRG
jgi:TM2 domain-containing membrane protein YozV